MKWNKNSGWEIEPAELLDLVVKFDGLNIQQQLIRIDGWLRANPRKRYKNWDRFVFNWLQREQPPAPEVVLSKAAEETLDALIEVAEKHGAQYKREEAAAALPLMFVAQGSLPQSVSDEKEFYVKVRRAWWEYLYYHDHYRKYGTKRSLQSFLTWDKWKGPHEQTDYRVH